jgi:predicted deacylase
MANPLGVRQWHLRGFQGRFDFHSGENFNRHFADLTEPVLAAVAGQLGPDADANVARVRAALREAVATLVARTPLEALRKTLLGLAIDADVVLDLHSDGEGLLHLYTTPQTWPQAEVLARCIGAEVALLAEHSGGQPFDEACSMVWVDLAARLGPDTPLPPACLAATIELRGEGDVRHDLAAADAEGIVRFLIARGVVAPEAGQPAEALPPLRCQPTPLAGSIPLVAPHGGMVVFLRQPGDTVRAGTPMVDIIDPLSGETTTLTAAVDGLFFARENRRFAVAGMALGKVAGVDALRSGSLLSA